MKQAVTAWPWVRLFSSVLLCGGVFAAWRSWPPAQPADTVFAALQAESTDLRPNDDATRARLSAERDQLARRVVPVPLADLKSRLGSSWTWQPDTRGRWLLSRSGSRPDDWTDVLADVAELERQPGVFIEQVELRGDGRVFTQAQVTIRVRGEAGETQPGLDPRPAPVSAKNDPAKASAVGRVRSLCRPGPSGASASLRAGLGSLPSDPTPGARRFSLDIFA
ncbi:MAG: hypothetical protein PHQ04_03970 [Opitutaceae bacterium]|nr:hypothetical protein [Opitutaceae bacterium]